MYKSGLSPPPYILLTRSESGDEWGRTGDSPIRTDASLEGAQTPSTAGFIFDKRDNPPKCDGCEAGVCGCGHREDMCSTCSSGRAADGPRTHAPPLFRPILRQLRTHMSITVLGSGGGTPVPVLGHRADTIYTSPSHRSPYQNEKRATCCEGVRVSPPSPSCASASRPPCVCAAALADPLSVHRRNTGSLLISIPVTGAAAAAAAAGDTEEPLDARAGPTGEGEASAEEISTRGMCKSNDENVKSHAENSVALSEQANGNADELEKVKKAAKREKDTESAMVKRVAKRKQGAQHVCSGGGSAGHSNFSKSPYNTRVITYLPSAPYVNDPVRRGGKGEEGTARRDVHTSAEFTTTTAPQHAAEVSAAAAGSDEAVAPARDHTGRYHGGESALRQRRSGDECACAGSGNNHLAVGEAVGRAPCGKAEAATTVSVASPREERIPLYSILIDCGKTFRDSYFKSITVGNKRSVFRRLPDSSLFPSASPGASVAVKSCKSVVSVVHALLLTGANAATVAATSEPDLTHGSGRGSRRNDGRRDGAKEANLPERHASSFAATNIRHSASEDEKKEKGSTSTKAAFKYDVSCCIGGLDDLRDLQAAHAFTTEEKQQQQQHSVEVRGQEREKPLSTTPGEQGLMSSRQERRKQVENTGAEGEGAHPHGSSSNSEASSSSSPSKNTCVKETSAAPDDFFSATAPSHPPSGTIRVAYQDAPGDWLIDSYVHCYLPLPLLQRYLRPQYAYIVSNSIVMPAAAPPSPAVAAHLPPSPPPPFSCSGTGTATAAAPATATTSLLPCSQPPACSVSCASSPPPPVSTVTSPSRFSSNNCRRTPSSISAGNAAAHSSGGERKRSGRDWRRKRRRRGMKREEEEAADGDPCVSAVSSAAAFYSAVRREREEREARQVAELLLAGKTGDAVAAAAAAATAAPVQADKGSSDVNNGAHHTVLGKSAAAENSPTPSLTVNPITAAADSPFPSSEPPAPFPAIALKSPNNIGIRRSTALRVWTLAPRRPQRFYIPIPTNGATAMEEGEKGGGGDTRTCAGRGGYHTRCVSDSIGSAGEGGAGAGGDVPFYSLPVKGGGDSACLAYVFGRGVRFKPNHHQRESRECREEGRGVCTASSAAARGAESRRCANSGASSGADCEKRHTRSRDGGSCAKTGDTSQKRNRRHASDSPSSSINNTNRWGENDCDCDCMARRSATVQVVNDGGEATEAGERRGSCVVYLSCVRKLPRASLDFLQRLEAIDVLFVDCQGEDGDDEGGHMTTGRSGHSGAGRTDDSSDSGSDDSDQLCSSFSSACASTVSSSCVSSSEDASDASIDEYSDREKREEQTNKNCGVTGERNADEASHATGNSFFSRRKEQSKCFSLREVACLVCRLRPRSVILIGIGCRAGAEAEAGAGTGMGVSAGAAAAGAPEDGKDVRYDDGSAEAGVPTVTLNIKRKLQEALRLCAARKHQRSAKAAENNTDATCDGGEPGGTSGGEGPVISDKRGWERSGGEPAKAHHSAACPCGINVEVAYDGMEILLPL